MIIIDQFEAPPGEPTPQEIRQHCESIAQEWTPAVRAMRWRAAHSIEDLAVLMRRLARAQIIKRRGPRPSRRRRMRAAEGSAAR